MEQKVYITEDAVTGIDEMLAALDSRVSGLIAAFANVDGTAQNGLSLIVESATNEQTTLWNEQAGSTNAAALTLKATLDKAYDDPAEDLEVLASKAYSPSKPIFRSNPKTNQAQSFRKHVAQNRFFAHDGLFLDPSARVFPYYHSSTSFGHTIQTQDQQKLVLQTTVEARHWSDFFNS
jgi:hypothetical protein